MNTPNVLARLSRGGCLGLVILAPLVPGAAAARPRLTLDGSVLAGTSTNPFLAGGGSTGSATLTASVSPRVTFEGPKSSVSLGATARRMQFTAGSQSNNAGSVDLSAQWRPQKQLSLSTYWNYDNSIAGLSPFATEGPNGGLVLDDLALSGVRARREFFRGQVNLSYRPTTRDTFTIDGFGNLANVKSTQAFRTTDYASYGTTLGYSRGIDQRTSLGASVGLNRYDCRNGLFCRTTTIQPQLTVSRMLNSRWTLQAAGGVALNKTRYTGFSGNQTTAAGSLNLCRKSDRAQFCLAGSRSTQATSSFGVRPATTISASYDTRISSRTTLGGELAYGSSSTGLATRTGGFLTTNFTYWNARLTGNREIGRNVRLTLTGGYDRSSGLLGSGQSNFDIAMGVSFSLGRQ